jgi:uncharacterized protein YpmB
MGRDNLEVLAQFLEEGIHSEEAAGAVQEEQRLADAIGIEFDRELAVAKLMCRFHYFALRLS